MAKNAMANKQQGGFGLDNPILDWRFWILDLPSSIQTLKSKIQNPNP
jgi:hypothetical protein